MNSTISNTTIAVLPFMNMSASQEDEYFSDGITEEIINALAKIEQLKVTSRTSAFHFKNQNLPIQQIGEALNVEVILEGSVRRAGKMVRITAQLIQVEDDFHFWSETWDRQLENIFEVQDEVSLLIAEKLRESFGHFEIQEQLVFEPTEDVNAYDYFLQGNYYFRKWNPSEMQLAVVCYQKALELDINHVPSYLGLADAYGFLATSGFLPLEETWKKASECTYKAFELDKKNSTTYYQLANLSFFMECNFEKAFQYISKAISLNPNYAEAHQFMVFLCLLAKEEKKGLEHLGIALRIDPLSPETLFYHAYSYYMLGDFEKALVQLNVCLEKEPNSFPTHIIKCYCLLKLKRYENVVRYFDQNISEIVVDVEQIGLKALAYVGLNELEKLTKNIEKLKTYIGTEHHLRASVFLFLVDVFKGNKEVAFEWMENDGKSNFYQLVLLSDPLLNTLQTDIRYQKYYQDISVNVASKIIKKSLLNTQEVENLSQKVLTYIESEKPYLDASLSLKELAKKIEIHPNQLSFLLNESLGKNFNEFINYYRVQTFKKLAQEPKNAHLTLLALAYESGFNSKTVFNTYFKKETGMTPKAFLKN